MSGAGVEKRGSAATVRACDLCRKRKRRCIWSSGTEGCTNCVNLKEVCQTTHVRKERAKPKRGNRIAEYEDRIKKLESLLQDRNAAQPDIPRNLLQPADPTIPMSTWFDNLETDLKAIPQSEPPKFDSWAHHESDISAPHSENGTSGNQSLIGAPGQDDVPTGDAFALSLEQVEPSADFEDDVAFLQATDYTSEELTPPGSYLTDNMIMPPPLVPGAECDGYLPPPELGTTLLAEYLTDFNTAYPLFRPDTLVNHLRICYAGLSDGSTVAWLSAYIMFGLAHMLRGMSATGSKNDAEMANYYLCRVYTAMNGLLISPPSLGLVQSLVGFSILIGSTSGGYKMGSNHFVPISLRIAQSLVYPRAGESTAPDCDMEQGRRVIWLGFLLDALSAITSTASMTHRRDEIIVPEPDEFPSDSLGSVKAAEGDWKVNIFYMRVKLAIIQAEVVEQLWNFNLKCGSEDRIDIELASTIILARLESWHEHELFKLSPGGLFQLLYRSDVAHVVSLDAGYFATVFRLRALLALGEQAGEEPFHLQRFKKVVQVRDLKCFVEAKRLLSLMPFAPQGDVAMFWMNHRVFMAALITVMAYHLHHPSEPPPLIEDMSAWKQTMSSLDIIVEKAGNPELAQCQQLIVELYKQVGTMRTNASLQA